MKERGILMSAPMVRPTLAGTKTQTRRVVKPVGADDCFVLVDYGDGWWPYRSDDGESIVRSDGTEQPHACPYGQPGDRLWVREAWRTTGDDGRCDDMPPRDLQPHPVWYEADGKAPADECVGKLRPGIFMPRWASRILLEVTGVRVERLQAISEADGIAEGIEPNWLGDLAQGNNGFGGQGWTPDNGWKHYTNSIDGDPAFTPQESYRSLWESINGAGSWDANPWVWVVEFRRVQP